MPIKGLLHYDARLLAHPPLLRLLLDFLLPYGTSKLFVRLPSLVAATIGSWFGYKWAERVFSQGTALGFLSLLTFLPGTMFPAVEARQYGTWTAGGRNQRWVMTVTHLSGPLTDIVSESLQLRCSDSG